LSARTDEGAMSKDRRTDDLSHGDLHDLVLVMMPPAPVTGRVVYNDGSPARRIAIKATRVGYAGTWAETQTLDDGRFEFKGPSDGTFDVTASSESGTGIAQGAAPGTPIEIVIHTPGGVRGTVHVGKAPATSFQVTVDQFIPSGNAKGQRAVPPSQHFLSADGRFEMGHLDAGAYDLVIHAAGAGAAHVHAVVADGAWAELDVPLAPSARATGRVHAGDKPIANARIEVACSGATTVSKADGSFELGDLAVDGCRMTVAADGYAIFWRIVEPGMTIDVPLQAAGGT